MAVYIPKYDGYIADVATVDFIRCDGAVFNFDELTSTNFSNTSNSITINGGHSFFPLAVIDTDKTLELSFASAQFTMDMFVMANAVTDTTADYGKYETKRYEVKDNKITIPYEVQAESVAIRNMTRANQAAAGKFSVEATKGTTSTDPKTEITFYEGDFAEGETIRVSYKRRSVNATRIAISTTTPMSKGEVYATWPVKLN